MPELPEVENICKMYQSVLVGQQVSIALVQRTNSIKYPSVEEFILGTAGKTINKLFRRGKYIVIELEDTSHIVMHLMLTGALIYNDSEAPSKSDSFTFMLDNGYLHFNDQRGFGWARYYAPGQDYTTCGICNLGPEPNTEAFTSDYLREQLHFVDKPIKAVLLDQSVIAGIGNIYGDEILFEAGIKPTKSASICTYSIETLYRAINKIIQWGIDTNEMSLESYIIGKGHAFPNTPLLKVYGKPGHPCPRCKTPITTITINNRVSHFCPHCQT